ncbi:AI-2E family transporter [Gemmatimonadetes bacterium T265]|nr:AI-2E family transporter [Gemmatimonadetes bacterium T265]
MRERRDRAHGWRSRDVGRAAAIVFAIYVLGQLVWFANSLLFVVFLGVLFGLAVAAVVDKLERFKIRRGVASALVVLGALGAIGGVSAWIAPTLTDQLGTLRQQLPAALDKVDKWVSTHQGTLIGSMLRSQAAPPGSAAAAADTKSGAAATPVGTAQPGSRTAAVAAAAAAQAVAQPNTGGAPSATESLKARLGDQLSSATKYLFPFLSSTVTVVSGLLLIIFLAVYVGAEPDTYHDGLMHLFPHRARKQAGEVLTEISAVLRKWLVTQLIAMAVIGATVSVAMLLLHVKAAFALGFIAGLLEFIPTVGPILSAVPALAMGFVDSPEKALYVLIAFWAIQFMENNFLIPFLMRGAMDLPPALTLVSQALMTLVFGFLGLMVAVPVTAAVLVPIKLLWVRDTIGDDVGASDDDAADADRAGNDDGREADKLGVAGPRRG